MTRVVAAGAIGVAVFICVLTMSAFAVRAGLVGDDAVALWATSIAAGDGGLSIGQVAAAYPTLPFLASTLIDLVTPSGTPAPALLAAAIAGGLAAAWFVSLQACGLSVPLAGAATALLVLHPGLLRAAVAGPAEILLAVFLYLTGAALFDLRVRSGVSEVMAVGLGLVGLAFSHPIGAALACAATPFLIFAVRPALAANSALNVVSTLVFPTIFAASSFAYVSWVFPGAGWSFLVAPAEGVSTWTAAFTRGSGAILTGAIALDAAIAMALALMLGAPVAGLAMIRVFRRRPLLVPMLVTSAATITAAALAVATRMFGDPVALTVAPAVLAALAVSRVPDARGPATTLIALLAAGWVGGTLGLALIDPRIAPRAENALAAAEGLVRGTEPTAGVDGGERAAALDLGGAIIGRDGVLVDSINAPAVVVGRGRAAGLVSPANEEFALSILTSSIRTPFVAVPDPQVGAGAQDRLNKAFPQLHQRGAQGYRLIYSNAQWRLYARQ